MTQGADEARVVSGDLQNFNIFDITQTLMMSRKTGLVTIQSGVRRGYVYFKDGQIVSALDDDLNTGEQAAFKIFYWRGGSFTIDFDAPPREPNIKLDTENLMLEVARHMDEGQRDGGDEDSGEQAVEQKFEDRFRSKLNQIFNDVATKESGRRELYTISAFDSLLLALNDLEGSALFLRPNCHPRVKTERGFQTIQQDAVTADEINGFLQALLTPRERDLFNDNKEVTTHYSTESAGTFQVAAFYDYGRPVCIFIPASRSITPLGHLGGDAEAVASLFENDTGLALVIGPMGGGKTTFLASLLERGLQVNDLLVALFSRNHTHSFSEDRGFMIRADLAGFSLENEGTLHGVVQQGADAVAVDDIASGRSLSDAVAVASTSSLVLGTVEADSLDEVAERLDAMIRTSSHPAKLCRRLGRCLIEIIEVDSDDAENGTAPTIRRVQIPPEVRSRITRGEIAALTSLATPAPA